MKTIQDIAVRLNELCRKGAFVQAYQELFAFDAISIDPVYPQEAPLKGLSLLIEREENFLALVKLGNISFSDPVFAGDYFATAISMTFKPTGAESKTVNEIAIYQVKDERIVSQQFFVSSLKNT